MSLAELARRTRDLDTARRLGQALWMLVGTRLELHFLIWSRATLGQDGDRVLLDALTECQALAPDNTLQPRGLCRLLCEICDSPGSLSTSHPQLVWTLPPQLGKRDERDSYCRAAVDLISIAERSLWLVSPFLEAHGVGRLVEGLLGALSREVEVNIITHDVGCLGAIASEALEDLRREATNKPGKLTVFSVDEKAALLVHSKIIVADRSAVLLGSANLTGRGLEANLEAGICMRDGATANRVLEVLALLLESGLVRRTFSSPSG